MHTYDFFYIVLTKHVQSDQSGHNTTNYLKILLELLLTFNLSLNY